MSVYNREEPENIVSATFENCARCFGFEVQSVARAVRTKKRLPEVGWLLRTSTLLHVRMYPKQ